MMETTTI